MRLLIVEDHRDLRDMLAAGLRAQGYAVDAAADGTEAWWYLERNPYDAAVLDIGLPGLNGLELVRRLRQHRQAHLPVLMLTARDSVEDRVLGLDVGADDYLVKPFAVPELLARLRALIRRGHGQGTAAVVIGDLAVDTVGRTVERGGRPVELTAREYLVLEMLARRVGQVVSRTELSEHVYDFDTDRDPNVLEVFISRLRKKLGPPVLIHTRRGLGYVLAEVSAEGLPS
jgi:DNA-binding response OmpR family regulator